VCWTQCRRSLVSTMAKASSDATGDTTFHDLRVPCAQYGPEVVLADEIVHFRRHPSWQIARLIAGQCFSFRYLDFPQTER